MSSQNPWRALCLLHWETVMGEAEPRVTHLVSRANKHFTRFISTHVRQRNPPRPKVSTSADIKTRSSSRFSPKNTAAWHSTQKRGARAPQLPRVLERTPFSSYYGITETAEVYWEDNCFARIYNHRLLDHNTRCLSCQNPGDQINSIPSEHGVSSTPPQACDLRSSRLTQ